MTMTTTTKPAPTGRLMTQPEVEEYLQISTSTIWRLIRDRKLRCLRIGTQKRFRLADVEAYLATCEDRPRGGIGTSVGHGTKKTRNEAAPSA